MPPQPGYPVRRFEHDTVATVLNNADELTQLITTAIRVDRLLLVAHSRGGLVARTVVDELIRDGNPANRYGDRASVTCWASRFDINGSSGFRIEVGHALAGALHDVDNGLVVPTSRHSRSARLRR